MNPNEQITPGPNGYDLISTGPIESVHDMEYVTVRGRLFLPTVIAPAERFLATEFQQREIRFKQRVTGAMWKVPEVREQIAKSVRHEIAREIMDSQVITLRAEVDGRAWQ